MSNPLLPKGDSELDAMILNELQVLLSEKRTSLSTMRTGIAVFASAVGVEHFNRHVAVVSTARGDAMAGAIAAA